MPNIALKANIWKYYLLNFFGTIQFYGPVFILFFQRFEFPLAQIMLFLSIYSVVTIALEIPTGIFADFFGRKSSLIISAMAASASFIIFATSSNYLMFCLAYAVLGVSGAFSSGTSTAFLYDTLLNLKQEHNFKKIQGTSHFVSALALVLSFLAGGYLYAFHFRAPYVLTAIAAISTIFISASLVEPKYKKSKTYKKHVTESFKLLFLSPLVRYLSLFSVLVSTGIVLSFFVNQPYLKLINIPVEYFGIILGIGAIINGLSAKFAHRIEQKLKEKLSLLIIPVCLALSYLLMSQFGTIYGFMFLFLISFSQGFSGPVLDDYINTHIGQRNRATVLSTKSFMVSISFAIFSPLLGLLADVTSLQFSFLVVAATIALVTAILLPLLLMARKNHEAN